MLEIQSCVKSSSWSNERSKSTSGPCNGDNCNLRNSGVGAEGAAVVCLV